MPAHVSLGRTLVCAVDFAPFAHQYDRSLSPGDQIALRMGWDPFAWAERYGLGAPLAIQSMLVPGCFVWERVEGRDWLSWGCSDGARPSENR